ncbi:alpha/beta fold hydrolase [Streptosporangium saharense]|uniref:alpha/beta fold hydrolase n=1 Tax=Streptosporangium saharense TaxID=1706840 RepID=UPI0036A0CCD9
MNTLTLHGHALDHDVAGSAGPTLLLLSGWCQDHRLFDPLVPLLADAHRVIRADWRGHGADRSAVADFGYAEQAEDLVALLDALGVDRVVPVSTSHGGWAALELADRLGSARVPRVAVIDWLQLEAPDAFLADLRAGQDPELWAVGRQRLFDTWLDGADCPPVAEHLSRDMGSFGFEMWARSCRVIEAAYARWGSPLARMAALGEPRPITHLYSQPAEDAYHLAQLAFGAEHPWYRAQWLGGRTHFPTLESPSALAWHLAEFVR